MGTYAVKGIFTFAIGGVFLIFAFGFINLFFNSAPTSMGNGMYGLFLAFIGFLFVGLGLWGIIQDVMISKTK